MEKESLKTVHETELENYLKKLNVLNDIHSGLIKCKFCSDVIKLDNIHAIFPESGQVKFVCDKASCIKELNDYLRKKKYGE